MRLIIDINCDLGEGSGHDAQIMPHVSSCNIACGGHAGNIETIKDTLRLAQEHGVQAGAHPSFEDKENFGRVIHELSESRFRESVTSQINLFLQAARNASVPLHHIKMHGALYHATAHRTDFAQWTIELLREHYPETPIYSLPNSSLQAEAARHGHPFIAEAFIDRKYLPDGSLVPRSQREAVISDPMEAARQLIQMVTEHKVTAQNGQEILLKADTFCLHGDNMKLIHRLPEFLHQLQAHEISVRK
jgi:UPF0271 protein